MPFQYEKVLLLGATSGIGWAMAEKFVATGTSVVVVGRRKDRLDAFVKQYSGSEKASVDSAVFDITDLQAIPKFAADQFEKHPDIDCVFLNSGLQRKVEFHKPQTINLQNIDLEVLTNYTSFMHLTKAFLIHLQNKAPKDTAIIYTTSGLALAPILTAINYCATKAALHHTILAMREQLKYNKSNVKIIELFPPAVQTELHDFESGEKGKDIGMPLNDFTEEAFEGLCREDNEQVPVQMVKRNFDTWEQERQKNMKAAMSRMQNGS